jgi:hypothetical protein
MNRLLLLLVVVPFAAFADVVFFAGNNAKVDIPPGHEHYFEDQRKTPVVVPAGATKVEMRFTFHSLRAYVKQRPAIGKEFVLDFSKKKGKPTFVLAENGGVGFVDFTQTSEYRGDKVQETHGTMGLDDGYVTFTISIAETVSTTPAAKQALESGFKRVLARIRSGGA